MITFTIFILLLNKVDGMVYLEGYSHADLLCVCVFTSIHREGFICLDQLGYQRTDQQCYAEDINFLC